MRNATMKIHGHPVLAFAQTETQVMGSGEESYEAACGYVLVQTRSAEKDDVHSTLARDEFVTAWYRVGEHEWSTGNYFSGDKARERAWNDFVIRVNRAGGVR